MMCKPELLKGVPLFSLLDDDETAVLAAQVETRTFAPRERIYKIGEPSPQAYVVITGSVRVIHGRRRQSRSDCRRTSRRESSSALHR